MSDTLILGGSASGYKYEFKPDGVYLTVYPNVDGERLFELSDMRQILRDCKVLDYDVGTLSRTMREANGRPQKISEPVQITKEELEAVVGGEKIFTGSEEEEPYARLVVEMTRDRMKATIRYDTKGGARLPTKEMVMTALKDAGVVYGINEDSIETGILSLTPFVVAEGTPPIPGENAYIDRKFNLGVQGKPIIDEAGRADYKDLNLFVLVKENQTLAIRIPQTKGTPGMNILGVEVPAQNGRPCPMPEGKNTKVVGEHRLIATVNGQIVDKGSRISVDPRLEIKGGVGVQTGDIDFDGWKESGMDSRAAFLASKVLAAVGKEPAEQTEQGRKNYVIAIDTLKSRLADCKTCRDVVDVVDDIYNEAHQTYTSQIKRTPEISAIQEEYEAAQKRASEMKAKFNDFVANSVNKKWTTSKEINAHMAEIEKMIQAEADRLEPGKNHIVAVSKAKLPGLGVYIHANVVFNTEEINSIRDKMSAKRRELREQMRLTNSTHEVWKQLGDKFTELSSSDTFQKHYAFLKVHDEDKKWYIDSKTGEKRETYYYAHRDKDYDKYCSWNWTEAKKPKHEKDSEIIKGKAKRRFEMIVPNTLERKGGRDVAVKSTAELKEMFNFRDIQTGTYVQTDPVSAKWHIDNIATGFADLCDVTGIPDNLVSLNGRLAIAVGARGHGKALAHYEPVERVINITKMKGGGSLGHEWFHSFDNLIAEAMNGGNYNQWLTHPNYHHTDKELGTDDTNAKVKKAFDTLVNAMMTGDTPETMVVEYKKSDYEAGKRLFEYASMYTYYGGFKGQLVQCKTLDEATKLINDKFRASVDLIQQDGLLEKKNVSEYDKKRARKTIKDYNDYLKLATAYFEGKEEGVAVVKTGKTVSRFYEDAKKLDNPDPGSNRKPYWSTKHEMAARAFEAYLCDKLREAGRKNDYLSGHADRRAVHHQRRSDWLLAAP